jgi:regulatory protein YycH of two-component signal transduction system YycFG
VDSIKTLFYILTIIVLISWFISFGTSFLSAIEIDYASIEYKEIEQTHSHSIVEKERMNELKKIYRFVEACVFI